MTTRERNREINRQKAIDHNHLMMEKYGSVLDDLVSNSKIYYIRAPLSEYDNHIKPDKVTMVDWSDHGFTKVKQNIESEDDWIKKDNDLWIVNVDTLEMVSHLQKYYHDGVCALNFASYNNPGGAYLKGSMAQEESLCHRSNLYEILSHKNTMQNFYSWNRNNKNRALYSNHILYIPRVNYQLNEETLPSEVSIITAAAPNCRAIRMYNYDLSSNAKIEALIYRILGVLEVARINKVKAFVAGAFGCGVFENRIDYVSYIFDRFQTLHYHKYFDLWMAILAKDIYKYNYAMCCKTLTMTDPMKYDRLEYIENRIMKIADELRGNNK